MKVIGVGLEKTGTTTLKSALIKLGYDFCLQKDELLQEKYHTLPNDITASLLQQKNYSDFFALIEQYNAFSDMPWPLLYQQIDQNYPDCKFVLTIRDENNWINSMMKYFGNIHSSIRELYYGKGEPLGNEDIYRKVYRQHIQNVRAYFKDRPDDLLIINWEEGDSWPELCHFLNRPIPMAPFPHANKYQNNQHIPKTFVAGTLLLPTQASLWMNDLYAHSKRASGRRLSFIAYPDLKDSGERAINRFLAGLKSKNHLKFLQQNLMHFDGYCSLLPMPFKEIDRTYPGSKFIFIQSQADELKDTFLGKLKQYVPWLPQMLIKRYASHLRKYEQNIQHYFKDRQQDFLILSIGEESTQRLIDFYG